MFTLTAWPQQVPQPQVRETCITTQRPGGGLQSQTYPCGLGGVKPPLRASIPRPHDGDHASLDFLHSGHTSTKAELQSYICSWVPLSPTLGWVTSPAPPPAHPELLTLSRRESKMSREDLYGEWGSVFQLLCLGHVSEPSISSPSLGSKNHKP